VSIHNRLKTICAFLCGVIAFQVAWSIGGSLSAHAGDAAQKPVPRVAGGQRDVAGGQRDSSNDETDVVVQLVSNNRVCSGTLVTSVAVLTARHCINGDDDNPPMSFPVTITIGERNDKPDRQYTSNNIITSKTWAAGPQTKGNAGNDIAVIFLDPPGTTVPGARPGPVLDYPQIVHPSLRSPCPTSGCGDDDGGTYSPAFGMAGWAPQDARPFRQAAFDSEFHHYPGLPDDRGQYWTHIQSSIHVNPGDSGGPLFVVRPDPRRPGEFYRDVIGVLSAYQHRFFGHDYDLWVDITRGAIADFVRNALADPIRRGPNWAAKHPNLTWFGDVDYYGPCQKDLDADCDHIYNVSDNCPTISNFDQRDSLDNGIGDACRSLPAPPPPPSANDIPTDCKASAGTCGSEVRLLCNQPGRTAELDVRIHPDTRNDPAFTQLNLENRQVPAGFYTFTDGTSMSQASYEICLRNDHATCGETFELTFGPGFHDSCPTGGGGGPGGGGPSPRPCYPHCPQIMK